VRSQWPARRPDSSAAPAGNRVVVFAFAANAVLSGGNSVAIRFSNRELAPLWGAGVRFTLAAFVLIALMGALKLALPRGRALQGALLYGVFQFSGAFGLYYYALVYIHAGLGQTLLALVPLVTLLLAVAQGQERFRTVAAVGTLLGVAGVALISRDPLREAVPLLALLAVLGSVFCFAQAAILVRRFPPLHPVVMNAVGMAVGAAILLALSALTGEPRMLPQRLATFTALGYVVAVGSVVTFLLHVFILQRWTASRASHVMVLIPFVTVLLSAWLDDEPVRAGLVVGGSLILTGVYLGALHKARRPPVTADAASGP
jgi:drug/metabolite transporter (DMT)-like permease